MIADYLAPSQPALPFAPAAADGVPSVSAPAPASDRAVLARVMLAWVSDRRLRLCSAAAVGLWMRLLDLMDTSERPGYLEVSGCAVSAEQIGALTGYPAEEVACCLAELLHAGVACLTAAGPIHCRVLIQALEVERQRAARRRPTPPSASGRSARRPASRAGTGGEKKGSEKGDERVTLSSPFPHPFSALQVREDATVAASAT